MIIVIGLVAIVVLLVVLQARGSRLQPPPPPPGIVLTRQMDQMQVTDPLTQRFLDR